jgi:hypothetical protein
MDLFEKLRAVALQQSMGGEFPDWLLEDILKIADTPDSHADKGHLIETLIMQIGDFDPYAGTGCFDNSVGPDAIRTTIRQIVAVEHDGRGGGKACELLPCCQFFNDNMKSLPKSVEYIKNKVCLDDYGSCSRYRIYKGLSGDSITSYLDPTDAEEVRKVMQCLREKQKQRVTD